jgi:hypothetical protein
VARGFNSRRSKLLVHRIEADGRQHACARSAALFCELIATTFANSLQQVRRRV